MQPIEGYVMVRETRSGPMFYARWRDSERSHRTRLLGPAWVERYGSEWRKRRGVCPENHLVPNVAAVRMRELIDSHEHDLAEARAGTRDGQAVTFKDVAWAWHEHGRTVVGWKPSTVRDRRSTLNGHLVPAFGARAIRDITRDDVRKWWNGLHDSRRKGGRLSDRNANKLLAELRAIFNWARDPYRLTENPGEGIRKHRELTSERPSFYSVAEVERLIRAAGKRDGLIFRVCAFAGLRRGEVISLRWRHIDFERSLMHIVENVSAGEDARVKDAEGRTVPLAPRLAKALKDWRPKGSQADDLVFPGTLPGRKLDGDALTSRYRAARDAAKLPPLRFHDLRHTFGSLAVDGGASLIQVQAWMGHADVKTSMRYLHTKSRTEDARLLDRAFRVTVSRGR